jgi:hypothetical protein
MQNTKKNSHQPNALKLESGFRMPSSSFEKSPFLTFMLITKMTTRNGKVRSSILVSSFMFAYSFGDSSCLIFVNLYSLLIFNFQLNSVSVSPILRKLFFSSTLKEAVLVLSVEAMIAFIFGCVFVHSIIPPTISVINPFP